MVHVIQAIVFWGALSIHTPAVEVRSDRVQLSHLVPDMPEPWASVDVGAAPEPRQSRVITGGDLARRISRARLDPSPIPLPGRTEVRRAGMNLPEPELRTLLQEALVAQLPAAFALRSVTLNGGIVMGVGAVTIRMDALDPIEGKQTMMATVASADGVTRRVPILVDLHRTIKAQGPVINRGQDIVIRLTHGSILIESTGTAQGPGALGDMIAVMPTSGTRVLHGRVLDGRTVEVQG